MPDTPRRCAVVVGGGIAGMVSALLLRRRFSDVILVERDAVLGGLLNSTQNPEGVPFDFGTHVLTETGVGELDDLVYGDLDEETWHSFAVLRNGSYFRGRMYRTSPYIDARSLDAEAFRRGFAELLATKPFRTEDCPDLATWLEHHVGLTFTREIHAPALRKHLGAALEDLHPATPFVLKRLVCADASESRRLKEDPFLDGKIAFASFEEGTTGIRHRYPRAGGIGRWVRGFEGRLRAAGVTLLQGRTVASIQRRDGRAVAATLDDGRRLPCDALAWTLPPFLLLKAAGIASPPTTPKQRPIALYHLVYDRPFLDDNYYVTCYDESLRVFRVTLYPNVRGEPGRAPHNCTVELIGESAAEVLGLEDVVASELVRMGLCEPSARRLSCEVRVVPAGFPTTTRTFMTTSAEQSALASEHVPNALLLGRAKCPPFFTTDVLVDVHERVTALTAERATPRARVARD